LSGRVVVDSGAVLSSPIVALSIDGEWIDAVKEHLQQRFITAFVRIIKDNDGFGVTSGAMIAMFLI
jgi:hypothetical protein